MNVWDGHSQSERRGLHVLVLDEGLQLFEKVVRFRGELLRVSLEHRHQGLQRGQVNSPHSLVKQVEHARDQDGQVGDLDVLRVARDLSERFQRSITRHVVQKAVVVDLDHLIDLAFIEVLVANRDEVSH